MILTLEIYGMESWLNLFTGLSFYNAFARLKTRLRITAAGKRTLARVSVSVFAGGLVLSGCGPAMTRPEVERQKLLTTRKAADEQATTTGQKIIVRLLERTKAEYDRRAASVQPAGD
jgi:hypothetical protein